MEQTVPQKLEKRILPIIATAELSRERLEYRMYWLGGLLGAIVGALAAAGVSAPIGEFVMAKSEHQLSIWDALAGFGPPQSTAARAAFVVLLLVVAGRAALDYLEFGRKGQAIAECLRRFRQWLADIEKTLPREESAARSDLDVMRNAMMEEVSRGVQGGYLPGAVSNDPRVDIRVKALMAQFRLSHEEVFLREHGEEETGAVQQRPKADGKPANGNPPEPGKSE
jgi:hypothetical protein